MTPRANDLSHYERCAAQWWNPRSAAFRSLHSVNAFRVELLRAWLGERLDGRVVVDLGCGGGLLTDPLARAGACVVGVDASRASVRAATEHIGPRFVVADVVSVPLATSSADVVLLADVLEHLNGIERALDEAARLLRPGGFLYVNTINATLRAKWLAVHLGEGLRLIPRGTHDHRLFVAPTTLSDAAHRRGLRAERWQGESVDVLRTLRRWAVVLACSSDLSVGYSALFRKGPAV